MRLTNTDEWNPIFVLHYQKILRLLKNPGILLFLVCFVAAFCVCIAVEPSLGRYISMLIAVAATFTSVLPAGIMAKRTIDKDLIHFTTLTQRQIVNGYFSIITFQNLAVCVLGFLIMSYFSIGSDFFWNIPLTVFLVFLGVEAFAACLLPFFAVVEQTYQCACMIFVAMYAALSVAFAMHSTLAGIVFYIDWPSIVLYLIVVFVVTCFGYSTACECRSWKGSFWRKMILLLTRYVYFIILLYAAFLFFLVGVTSLMCICDIIRGIS